MEVQFAPQDAATLAAHAAHVTMGARELAQFGETDPVLAGECGVETASLEARTILSGGLPDRLAASAADAVTKGKALGVPRSQVDALSRLEAVVALGSSRIGIRLAAMDSEAQSARVNNLGSLIGVATGVVGLVRSIW